jgi:hypothetical protein
MEIKVKSAGRLSVTVTVPPEGPALAAFETVTEYVAFC